MNSSTTVIAATVLLPTNGCVSATELDGVNTYLHTTSNPLFRKYSKAAQYYQQAIHLDATDPGTLEFYAYMRAIQGDSDAARKLVEQAISLNPQSPFLLRQYGRSL